MSNHVFTEHERDLALRLFARVREETTSEDSIGVHRPSYGRGESDALRMVGLAAQELGLHGRTDFAANLVISTGQPITEDPVMVGSHLDAVPCGGNYDGLAGVVAALLVVKKARDRRLGVPVVGYGLRGEESAWFGIPYMGARALVGKLSKDDLWKCTRDGTALGTHMSRAGVLTALVERGDRILPPTKEFWELHIEQGPVLVDEDFPVGAVTAIRGNVRAPSARIFGQAGHSGTTPHKLRKDAVLRFAEMLVACDQYRTSLHDAGKDVVMTCGSVGTIPEKHSMTTIADEVKFSLDIRSTEAETAHAMMAFAQKFAGDTVDWGDVVITPGMTVDPGFVERTLRAASHLGIPCRALPSGAGHDATIFQAAGIPSGMVFVRNRNGSHNPQESMEIDDFMLGVETLYRVISTVQGSP